MALLNKRLGTTSDQLEEMASSGAMSVNDLKMAFLDSATEIEAEFGNVQYSITDALTVIRSKWGLWLAQTNETLGHHRRYRPLHGVGLQQGHQRPEPGSATE